MIRPLALIAASAALAVPAISIAQVKQAQTATGPSGSSTADEIARTRTLNQQQADAARAQQDANVASEQQYRSRIDDYESATAAASAARAAYEAEMEANRQARAAYDAAYVRWQADVAACTAGDYSRCQSSAPAPK